MSDLPRLRVSIQRFVNQYNRLEKLPFDIGAGEVLHPSEMHLIEAVGRRTGDTVTRLCEAFGVTKGAVSQLVTKLEGRGYVQRIRTGARTREVEIRLTEKGEEVFRLHERFHHEMDQSMEQLLKALPDGQISLFLEVLERAGSHLEAYANRSAEHTESTIFP